MYPLYKAQREAMPEDLKKSIPYIFKIIEGFRICLLYTSDAADERSSVDLGGRRIIKKKNMKEWNTSRTK